jgi:hypothetical protein
VIPPGFDSVEQATTICRKTPCSGTCEEDNRASPAENGYRTGLQGGRSLDPLSGEGLNKLGGEFQFLERFHGLVFRLALSTRKARPWSSPISGFVGEAIQEELDLAVHARSPEPIRLNGHFGIKGMAVR